MPGPPAETPYRFFSLLGMVASGDLGPITCYRSHLGKIVVFSKTWPKKHPSMAQLTGRARMSFGAEQWRGFLPTDKDAWNLACQIASLPMTGYNLWQRWWHQPQYWDLLGLIRETGINLWNHIQITRPAIPANWKVEPFLLLNPPTKGIIRYGRPWATMRPNTLEWVCFLPYNPQLAIGTPLVSIATVFGYGRAVCDSLFNGRWARASFESWIMPTISNLEVKCWFPDGTFDATEVTFQCRDLNP